MIIKKLAWVDWLFVSIKTVFFVSLHLTGKHMVYQCELFWFKIFQSWKCCENAQDVSANQTLVKCPPISDDVSHQFLGLLSHRRRRAEIDENMFHLFGQVSKCLYDTRLMSQFHDILKTWKCLACMIYQTGNRKFIRFPKIVCL